MEKWIHRISFIITFCIMYVVAGYSYLSYKGFVYHDGSFELVKPAQAGLLDFVKSSDKEEEQQPKSAVLARDIALNFSQTTVAGSQDAPLTIFEFSSLSCTHCADFHLNGIPKLEKDFLSSGKIRIVFIHFPIDRGSMKAAMLSECVNPDKKADFINLVFKKQREWTLAPDPEKHLINYAVMSGMNATAAESCLKNDKLAAEILSDRQDAIAKLDIKGTPAFLLSDAKKNEILYGIANFADFKALLNERLAEE